MHSLTIYKWAFEHSTDGMLITDAQGNIQRVNDAFCNMFGYAREDVVGKRTTFLRSQFSTPEFYREMWSSLSANDEWRGEIVNRARSGEEIPCFLTISSIYTDEGEKIGYLGVEIDIRERKLLEARVEQGEKLAMIGEALATLAHEIRNPLNGISMNIHLLRHSHVDQGPWTEDDAESIDLIAKETDRLQQMVKSVLSFARAIEIKYERVLTEELVREVYELMKFDAEEAGVSLEIELDRAHNTVRCDPGLIKQVLLNLMRNAIEAASLSAEKRVKIYCRLEEKLEWHRVSSSGKVVLFEVTDTGPGMSEKTQEMLFQPFFTTKEKGLGLGLATSFKIVRQHHGVLEVASGPANGTQSKGTSFVVALPA